MDYVPPNAVPLVPILRQEQERYWPAMPNGVYLAGQVEQESCVSLKSPRCWSPTAELKTSREQGVGLGQITRTARFDALAGLRNQYRSELAGWSWASPSLYDPRYQLRAIVLMDATAYGRLTAATPDDLLAKTFAAYNGGLGGVLSDERICKATAGCDWTRWWGNVEKTSLKSKTVQPGYGKPFFYINREYPYNIMRFRWMKYQDLWSKP